MVAFFGPAAHAVEICPKPIQTTNDETYGARSGRNALVEDICCSFCASGLFEERLVLYI